MYMHINTHILSLTRAFFASSPQGGLETCHNACTHIHTYIYICIHIHAQIKTYIYICIYISVRKNTTQCVALFYSALNVWMVNTNVCVAYWIYITFNMPHAQLCLPFTNSGHSAVACVDSKYHTRNTLQPTATNHPHRSGKYVDSTCHTHNWACHLQGLGFRV